MFYYLNGVFVNEFDGNSDASGDINYDDLKNFYAFQYSRVQSIWIVVFIGVIYRLIWLLLLAVWDTSNKQDGIYRSRVSQVRRKARKLVHAGLRWRGTGLPYSSHIQSSEVTNAMMEEDAFAELEANIGKAYILKESMGSHRSMSSEKGKVEAASFGGLPSASFSEQLSRVVSSLPDEYTGSGNEAGMGLGADAQGSAIISPLGRSSNSVSASSGHIDI